MNVTFFNRMPPRFRMPNSIVYLCLDTWSPSMMDSRMPSLQVSLFHQGFALAPALRKLKIETLSDFLNLLLDQKFTFLGKSIQYFHGSTDTNFWIGLNSLRGNWSWTDNSTVGFNELNPSQNTSLNCGAETTGKGDWRESDCYSSKPYVCQVASDVTPTYPPYLNCSDGWYYFEPAHSCYGADKFIGFTNWTQGEDTCLSQGAHLVSIHSFEEAKFVNCKLKILV